ncbi:MAG: trimethylamine methyltransferase family protein [Candidatus Brocadiae bacterium]|nr:trimethylamine methyltransferase family protein [Candidatus Brocadiia bacterium]
MLSISSKQVQTIADYALEILEKEGCIYNSGNALSLLSYRGCNIEEKISRAYIPSQKMKEVLKKFLFKPLSSPKLMSGSAHFFLDMNTKKKRSGTADDAKKMVAFASQLKNVEILSTMVDLENTKKQEQYDIILRYSQKPFFVNEYSPEIVHDLLAMTSIACGSYKNLQENPRIYGAIELESPFCYSASHLDVLGLYAKHGQTICLKSSYEFSTEIPPQGLLSLQMAEWLAGIFYIHAMEYPCSVCIQLPSFPFGTKIGHYQSLLDYISYQHIALLVLEQLSIPVSLPILPILGLGFLSGWVVALQRSIAKKFHASYLSDAGKNEPNTFSPLHLLIEDECVSYLNQIDFEKEDIPNLSLESMLSPSQKKQNLWLSPIFHYNMKDIWRKKKATWQDTLREYTIDRWNASKVEPVLSSATLQELDKVCPAEHHS